ncbi:MAG: glucosaminidase domain-containing protein [Bacteroidales bacterium]
MSKFIHNIILPLIFITSVFSSVNGQQQITLEEYIERFKDIAMEEMRTNGIPASIKLAQGILESGFGNSDLAVIGNNHFGIKCHGWAGRTFFKDDDARDECFRAYDNPDESYRDHSEFLTGRERYADLFKLDMTDYKGWAKGLRKAGYATNSKYPDMIIGIIERNSLYEFDQLVIATLNGKTPAGINSRPAVQTAGWNTSGDQLNRQDPDQEREIHENNRVNYIYARQGDTAESIAEEFGMWPREIYRYNDMESSGGLKVGQMVYLQPKRRRSSEQYHFVKSGETMYDISQKYAVRLKSLYKRNNMEEGQEPETGQRIYLRGRARD